ncbi:hypothetical protein [Saccharibacillus sacchari]|uniref:Uncharacterized protein n=1 Tax=Saccharibacillus sacchari TaxID=456493 RepID=A0ACC6P915_9BACL
MRRIWKLGIALVLGFASLPLVLPMQKAVACSCEFPENAEDAKQRAAATFTGTVKHIEEFEDDRKEKYNAVTLDVDQSWKGVMQPEMVVYTSWSSCQFGFDRGKTYLLYTHDHDGRQEITNCGRSGEVVQTNADVIKDLQDLGTGTTFAKPPDGGTEMEDEAAATSRSWLPFVLGGCALIVIVAGGWIAVRSRRK